MKLALALLCVFTAGHALASSEHAQQQALLAEALGSPRAAYESWLQRFGKTYNGLEEYESRYLVYLDNLKFAHEYNAQHTSHWLGLNSFADRTHDEFKQHALGYRSDLRTNELRPRTSFSHANVSPPKEVDWREKDAVTPVKNQQLCGSCWAFSTTGAIEGVNAIVTGNLQTASEQELVDCDTVRDHGCHGGLMDFAFDYVINNKGIDTEEDYPYKAEEDTCDINRQSRRVITIDDYEDVPPNDEAALLKAVAVQPVSVAIEADERAFQLYAGGVFDATCGTALDHGVLAVGYGTFGPNKTEHWIIKNSWGAEWGDKGYIKLLRGLGGQGQCGIAMQASYPIKKGPNPPEPPPSPPKPAPTPKPAPGPSPVDCDPTTQCPAKSTCCCAQEFFGFCMSWACCPLPKATCCDDQEHCCPSNLPVCDTTGGRCMAKAGDANGAVPWSVKQPAMRKAGLSLPRKQGRVEQ